MVGYSAWVPYRCDLSRDIGPTQIGAPNWAPADIGLGWHVISAMYKCQHGTDNMCYLGCRRKLALINNGKRKQQQKYIDDIYTLIRASSKEEYMELLLSMSVTWDKVSNLIRVKLVHKHDHVINSSCQLNCNCFQSFYAYFYDNIHSHIDRIGRGHFLNVSWIQLQLTDQSRLTEPWNSSPIGKNQQLTL